MQITRAMRLPTFVLFKRRDKTHAESKAWCHTRCGKKGVLRQIDDPRRGRANYCLVCFPLSWSLGIVE